MKTIREIIAEYMPNKDISAEMVDKLYEYKNQRVIEELGKLRLSLQDKVINKNTDVEYIEGIDFVVTLILNKQKELKQ
jgi:plastocyanin domain-containing protein